MCLKDANSVKFQRWRVINKHEVGQSQLDIFRNFNLKNMESVLNIGLILIMLIKERG